MKLINIALIILMLTLSVQLVGAIGIGVAPSELVFDNALKGSSYEKEMKIDNTGDKEILALIKIEEHEDWFTLDPGLEVNVPAKGSSRVKVKIDIPKDTPNGDYETMINVQGQPSGSAEGMGLIPGAAIKAKITVTDKRIIKGYVDNILTRDTTTDEEPKFTIGFLNQGNVQARPSAEITINDETVKRTLDTVDPGKSRDLAAKYDKKLELGYYQANVKVFLENELLSEKTVSFSVVKGEGLAIAEEAKTNPLIGIALIVVIVIVGFAVYYGLRSMSKKGKK